jgi:hypothetical protein
VKSSAYGGITTWIVKSFFHAITSFISRKIYLSKLLSRWPILLRKQSFFNIKSGHLSSAL